jgi:hypothetical protein
MKQVIYPSVFREQGWLQFCIKCGKLPHILLV